jgi:amino acid transporter
MGQRVFHHDLTHAFIHNKGNAMNTVTLILILLTAFNLSMLVMKVWGDRFPQPHARKLHANWLQGWRNTKKPLNRFWLQVVIMVVILMAFNIADEMFVGFLVFVRLIVFCMGYKRAKLQIAQATVLQDSAVADQ